MSQLADNLKALRDAKGWSQSELEEASGISRTQISRIERDKDSNPTIQTIVALATALNTTIDGLVFNDESSFKSDYLMRSFDKLNNEQREIGRKILKSWVMLCQAENME